MSALFEFSPEEVTAIRLSLWVAFWVVVCSLLVALAAALLLTRAQF